MKTNQTLLIIGLGAFCFGGCTDSDSSNGTSEILNTGEIGIPSPDSYRSSEEVDSDSAVSEEDSDTVAENDVTPLPDVQGEETQDASAPQDVAIPETVEDVEEGKDADTEAPDPEDVLSPEDTESEDDSATGDVGDDATGDVGDDTSADGDEPGKESVTRFVSFGDQGEGNDAQYAVGAAAATVCEERGCDFALLLGDNFYDVGVSSVDDPQFETKFELPYADLDMPFYVVLGNHDYGETSFEWYRGEFQKQYALQNPKWVFPKEYYSFETGEGLADFFAFDTARLMWGDMEDEQRDFLNTAIGDSEAIWKVAFAHHPYLSNGKHGNAGNYEGFSFIPIASGATVKDFMDDVICGKVDLYLSGHDHNRQSFTASASNCGVNFIVNGASSKSSDFAYHDDNFTLWDDDQKEGFVWLEIDEEKMTVVWYDSDGNIDFEYTIDKP